MNHNIRKRIEIGDALKALWKIFHLSRVWYPQLYSFRNDIGLKKNITNWKNAYFTSFPASNFSLSVFINNATQDCHSYLISMSKLKSFKFSSKWRQERIFYSMRLVSMLKQTKNIKIERFELDICSWRHFKEDLKLFNLLMDIK